MTPYQLAAFRYPCTVEADLNRPNMGSAEQLAQWGPGAPVAPVHHHERGFRVGMIVDAIPGSAGIADEWPAWVVTVALRGAMSQKHKRDHGKAHPERPLGAWGALLEQQALHIIRRELRGVGQPGTDVIVDKAAAIRMFNAQARAPSAAGRPGTVQPPVAVFGRKRMTLEEAVRCLRVEDDAGVLALLNPHGRESAPSTTVRTGFDL